MQHRGKFEPGLENLRILLKRIAMRLPLHRQNGRQIAAVSGPEGKPVVHRSGPGFLRTA